VLLSERLEPDTDAREDRCRPPLRCPSHWARQYTRGVPIYEYACMKCESHFDELVRSADQAVTCPECGAGNVLKQLSTFAVLGAKAKPAFSGPTGGGGGCCGGSCGCGH
jgi:putative FmdB family regulatory protein